MREMLIGAAKLGAFEPLWSARILEEWRRACLKHGPLAAMDVECEATLLNAAFPKAVVAYNAEQEARFWLPDPSDIHVIAAASIGCADGIITLNNKDFPIDVLAEEGLSRVNPDAFLLGVLKAAPVELEALAQKVLGEVNEMSDKCWTLKSLMKKARLPRLGKALSEM